MEYGGIGLGRQTPLGFQKGVEKTQCGTVCVSSPRVFHARRLRSGNQTQRKYNPHGVRAFSRVVTTGRLLGKALSQSVTHHSFKHEHLLSTYYVPGMHVGHEAQRHRTRHCSRITIWTGGAHVRTTLTTWNETDVA